MVDEKEIINKEWWYEHAKEFLDKAKGCLEYSQRTTHGGSAEYWRMEAEGFTAQAKECIAQVGCYD